MTNSSVMSGVRNVTTLASVELRLFLRDRSNLFFAFVFPLLLVMMIGLQFGDEARAGRAAVTGSPSSLRGALSERLETDGLVVSTPPWDVALTELSRGRLDVAIRVSADADTSYTAGENLSLEVVRGPTADTQLVEQEVRTAVEAIRLERARVEALEQYGVPADRAGAALAAADTAMHASQLKVQNVDALSQEFAELGQFDYGASGQLLLFVFLSSLAGSATLIRARRAGVVARMLAGPVTAGEVVAGQIAGRWLIGVFQGCYIIVATRVLFGVHWGSVPLALLVLAIFSLVAAGAAILLGSVMENEGAASGAGVGLGLVLAALGGSMLPLELFPTTIRHLANLTPHAWAYTAFAEVQRRGGTLTDVLPQLGVLTGIAVLVASVGAWTLRRGLARPM